VTQDTHADGKSVLTEPLRDVRPLYVRAEKAIRELIIQLGLVPGDHLPAELELAKMRLERPSGSSSSRARSGAFTVAERS